MKRNILIAGIAGFVILGGAVGANAISNSGSNLAANVKPSGKAEEKKHSIISTDKAVEIAINKVGGVMESVELEKDDGRLIYEIDLDVPGYNDVDVDLDAVTGEVIKVDKEINDDDDDDYNDKRLNGSQNVKITKEKAISIALSDTSGEVTDVDFDSDDNEYEIEIKSGNKEVEIKIDAQTGKILEKEIDHDDDN